MIKHLFFHKICSLFTAYLIYIYTLKKNILKATNLWIATIFILSSIEIRVLLGSFFRNKGLLGEEGGILMSSYSPVGSQQASNKKKNSLNRFTFSRFSNQRGTRTCRNCILRMFSACANLKRQFSFKIAKRIGRCCKTKKQQQQKKVV